MYVNAIYLYFDTAPCDQESPELQTLIACTPQLTSSLSLGPVIISEHLMAKGLFPHYIHSQLLHSTDNPRDKAHRLVDVVTKCVQAKASDYDVFIAVLKEQGACSWTKNILDILIKTYSEKSKFLCCMVSCKF